MVKPLIAIFGGGHIEAELSIMAEALGRELVDAGFRILCGGLGGVMAAVTCGARSAAGWTGAEAIGLLPGWTRDEQPNPWIDIALRTDMGSQRNNLLARMADAAIAIGGGAGTLSEIALSWHEGRPIACLDGSGGWAERLAGERLDARRERPIVGLPSVAAALTWLDDLFPRGVWPRRRPTRWWPEQVPHLSRTDAELESRLRALAERVRAWNHARDQRRQALVTIDHGHGELMELTPIFAALPELAPVLFVSEPMLEREPIEQLRDAGWLLGALGSELGQLDPAELGPRLIEARRTLVARGGVPWLAWPEGHSSPARIELARRAGFTLQLGSEPELVLRTRW